MPVSRMRLQWRRLVE